MKYRYPPQPRPKKDSLISYKQKSKRRPDVQLALFDYEKI